MPDTTTLSDDAPAAEPSQGQSPLRASDADRHATVHLLQDAVARGLLTTDEGGERMAAAYAARNLDDLPLLTADLPPAPAPAQASIAPGWRPLAAQAWTQTRASVSALTAGGWRSTRTLAVLAAFIVALLVLIALGAAGLDLLAGGPDGHGGVAARH
jgi:hypothetical protein